MRPAVLALLAVLTAGCAQDAALKRQFGLADRAIHRGRYGEAERALQAASRLTDNRRFGMAARLELWRLEGDIRLLQARPADALPLYEKAHEAASKAYGAASPRAGEALLDVADARAARGEAREAERLYRVVLATAGRGEELAARLSDLALTCQSQGRVGEAERLYRLAIEETERVLGPGDPLLAARLEDLGLLLQHGDRSAEAEKAYRRALAVYERAFAPGHPRRDTARNSLGLFLESLGRYADAEAVYRRALDEAAVAALPRRSSAARPSYAALLRRLGREAEAVKLETVDRQEVH